MSELLRLNIYNKFEILEEKKKLLKEINERNGTNKILKKKIIVRFFCYIKNVWNILIELRRKICYC